MGELVSFIPQLLAEKNISKRDFIVAMINKGVSHDTAYRLFRGDVNFNAETIRKAAQVLGVESINEVIDITGNGQHE